MNEQERLALAKRQVGAIKGFYIHLAVFVLVMAVLLAANASVGTRWWVQWPFFGWGIGVPVLSRSIWPSRRRRSCWQSRSSCWPARSGSARRRASVR